MVLELFGSIILASRLSFSEFEFKRDYSTMSNLVTSEIQMEENGLICCLKF